MQENAAPATRERRITLGCAASIIGPDVAHYAIEERIGGGALTAVYRARDTVLDRLVALKVLLQGADETMRERFRREARTAAMLEHPNIVRTYQVGKTEDSGLTFIAMELVQGPSLAELLERVHVMEPADAAAFLEPIARALAYAHERGVIHRDVKPSNILLQSVDRDHPLERGGRGRRGRLRSAAVGFRHRSGAGCAGTHERGAHHRYAGIHVA